MNLRFDNRKRPVVAKLVILAVFLFASFNLLHCVQVQAAQKNRFDYPTTIAKREKLQRSYHETSQKITEIIEEADYTGVFMMEQAQGMQKRISKLKRQKQAVTHEFWKLLNPDKSKTANLIFLQKIVDLLVHGVCSQGVCSEKTVELLLQDARTTSLTNDEVFTINTVQLTGIGQITVDLKSPELDQQLNKILGLFDTQLAQMEGELELKREQIREHIKMLHQQTGKFLDIDWNLRKTKKLEADLRSQTYAELAAAMAERPEIKLVLQGLSYMLKCKHRCRRRLGGN